MTKAEIQDRLREIISHYQGRSVGYVLQQADAKSLQDALGVTSLEVVSIQMAIEDAFGLEFGTGLDRGPIDDEWDACRSVAGLEALIEKWTKETP